MRTCSNNALRVAACCLTTICWLAAGNARAGTVLFTTQEDWAQWVNGPPSSMTTTGVNTTSLDSSTTNGAGNNASPGGAGTNGSMQTVWNSGSYNFFSGPGEQGNQSFMSAIDPGAVAGVSTVAYSGVLTVDYTKPPAGTGNYFQLGLLLNYSDNFGQFFGTEVDNGNGTFTATIPYTINAVATLGYFQPGLIYNSNYNTNTPFTVDNITAVPEPASFSLIALGGLAALAASISRRRRRENH
jgi:hypothetical protein